MPAPSPITKPSRSSSHGREARSGVSLKWVESARAAAKPATPEPADRGLGAAGDHHVGIAERDQPAGVADRMRAGRAGGHDRMVRALEAEPDRDLAAHQVDQAGRDEERADPPRTALLELDRGVRDRAEAADAGADQHPGALARGLVLGLPAGVAHRLDRGRDAVDDEQIVLARVLGRHRPRRSGTRPRPRRSAPGPRSWPADRRRRTGRSGGSRFDLRSAGARPRRRRSRAA